MSYIQNYGFTKTLIRDNNRNINNEIEWLGNYDGNIANINININDNGKNEIIDMRLNNNDIMEILGVQPVEMPMEQRLINDFLSYPNKNYSTIQKYRPLNQITLEGTLIKRKKKSKSKRKHKYKSKKQGKTHKLH
jgi:hypothetical protein